MLSGLRLHFAFVGLELAPLVSAEIRDFPSLFASLIGFALAGQLDTWIAGNTRLPYAIGDGMQYAYQELVWDRMKQEQREPLPLLATWS